MSEKEYDFDVIIVGAGLAGSAAALSLTKEGKEVAIIERGQYAGAKNVSGGALYGPILNKIAPNYWEEDAIERFLTTKKITMLSEKRSVTIDVDLQDFADPPYNGVTVIRPKFDRWLAGKAEEAGTFLLPDTVVEDFVWKDNQIVGIKSGEDVLHSKLVIIAEGAATLLTEKAKLAKQPHPRHHAVGMKETYKLDRAMIEERFHLQGNEGMSNEILGYTHGIPGGGFFYTNKETLSFGLILNIHKLAKKKLKATEVFEDFKSHPYIQKLLKDAEMIEYSAHTIPEGGFKHMPKLYGNGVLVAGDAAGMVLNAGLYIEGMNFALEAGRIAGEASAKILERGDLTRTGTLLYEQMLRESFVYKDLKKFKRAAKFLENERVFTVYPDMMTSLMYKLLHNTGEPRKRIVPTAIKHILKKGGLFKLLGDAFGAFRSI
ncbi:MAG: FAD-dependent oxidoreductase [Candidatus Heimdallarchaeaceae archaeon]